MKGKSRKRSRNKGTGSGPGQVYIDSICDDLERKYVKKKKEDVEG